MDYKEKEKPKRPYINGMAIASALGAISTRFERVFDPMPKRVLTEEDKRLIAEDDKIIREMVYNALRHAARREAEEERIRNERIKKY